MTIKYSDQLMLWLKEEGYTHCLFLAGGGSMHLLDSANKYFECIPFVHEVSAAIATEYFNESSDNGKAFCLVTTGPGLTNTLTGVAGSWLESHELLVIAGQVKTSDLASGGIRQRGIQELPGIEMAAPISKCVARIQDEIEEKAFKSLVRESSTGRKGPVVIEVCIDISARPIKSKPSANFQPYISTFDLDTEQIAALKKLIINSKRPLLLLGSGISRESAKELIARISPLGIPIAATWSGADRISSDYEWYAGRPNTFGMRWANVFQQQTDLLIAVGARLGLQQTGFNWQEFTPVGKIVMVDIDKSELEKGHPRIDLAIHSDANTFHDQLANLLIENLGDIVEWQEFLNIIKETLPRIEDCHSVAENYIDPFNFIVEIEKHTKKTDIFAPGTSGGTHTAFYQMYFNKFGQKIIPNKGLASMGYGLAGAIGAAISNPDSRVINFEGDGSFSQNTQELATVSKNNLNLKMFIVNNSGYASIRTSQINYFNGNYIGCDAKTGLGFPSWELLAEAYNLRFCKIDTSSLTNGKWLEFFNDGIATVFELIASPHQIYEPRITSYIRDDGSMNSNPIHLMTPPLDEAKSELVFKYFKNG